MKTFLIVMMVMYIVGIVGISRDLSGAYPRRPQVRRGQDIISLVIQVALLVWVIHLLELFK